MKASMLKEEKDIDAVKLMSGALLKIIEHHHNTYSDDNKTLFGIDISTVIELESSLRHPSKINLADWEDALRRIASCSDESEIDVENLMRGLVRYKRSSELAT